MRLDPYVTKLAEDGTTWELRKEAIQTMAILAPDMTRKLNPKVMPILKRRMDYEIEPSYLVRMTAVQAIGGARFG